MLTQACCTLPPVSAEYTPKGTWGQTAGLKAYQIGPEDAQKAILMVYDVFGFSPQILQGESLAMLAMANVVGVACWRGTAWSWHGLSSAGVGAQTGSARRPRPRSRPGAAPIRDAQRDILSSSILL